MQVVGLSDVVAVAAGYDHSLALKADGTLWSWGNNSDGQLGDGTTTVRLTPVQVPGLSGVTSIVAGDRFSVAVQGDGAAGGYVWAWGRNTVGQLGDGSTTMRPVPVRVVGIDSAVQVAAGEAFAVALLRDGSIRVWGANDTAQLGDLSGTPSNLPIALPALSRITAVAAGARHAVAVDSEGRVWGWGTNANSQLGRPNVSPETGVGAPVSIAAPPGMFAAAGGFQHTLLLRADGSVWAAGSLSATGLGAGTHDSVAQIPGLTLAPNSSLLTDADGDGLPAWQEYLAGLDPLSADTNGNGLSDLIDHRRQGQSVNPDDDGDGVPNIVELSNGTDPFRPDTDGDGATDLLDDYPLDPARSQKPAPDPNDLTPPVIILLQPASARPVGGGGQ